MIRDAYHVDVDKQKFDQLFTKLNSDTFRSLQSSYAANGCTDGVQSFLVSQNGGNLHFVSRHNCDPTYQADISQADSLVGFAIGEMPYLEKKLRQFWNAETGQE